MSEGKVRVYIRSRMAPASVIEVSRPVVSYAGQILGSESARSVRFESRLDDEHQNAIDEGRRLADQMGLELEVVDESKSNPLVRALGSILGRSRAPKLVITPSYGPALAQACGTLVTAA